MLSSLRSYLSTQFLTEDNNSAPESSKNSAKPANIGNNEDFVSGLKGINQEIINGLIEILSFASESSAKLAGELKSTAKHISDKVYL